MGKLLKGRGDSVGKGEMLLVWLFFLAGDVANVIFNCLILTFNYILVIVFLFPLNVGVSHCFQKCD